MTPVASINDQVDPTTPAAVVVESGEAITFGDLEERSRRLAQLLRARGVATVMK